MKQRHLQDPAFRLATAYHTGVAGSLAFLYCAAPCGDSHGKPEETQLCQSTREKS